MESEQMTLYVFLLCLSINSFNSQNQGRLSLILKDKSKTSRVGLLRSLRFWGWVIVGRGICTCISSLQIRNIVYAYSWAFSCSSKL